MLYIARRVSRTLRPRFRGPELWPILLLLGVERVRIAPGIMAKSDLDFVSYPISHSLLTAVGWSIVIGLVYFVARRRARGAWIVGALVASHWVLDLTADRHRHS